MCYWTDLFKLFWLWGHDCSDVDFGHDEYLIGYRGIGIAAEMEERRRQTRLIPVV